MSHAYPYMTLTPSNIDKKKYKIFPAKGYTLLNAINVAGY